MRVWRWLADLLQRFDEALDWDDSADPLPATAD
jgi:hypothetical protein